MAYGKILVDEIENSLGEQGHNALTNRDSSGSHPASAISTESGLNVQEKLDHSVAVEVETTEYLINSFDGSALDTGDVVRTLGYYAAGDGGGAEWLKTDETGASSQSPSDMGDITLTTSDGGVYKMSNYSPTVQQLGWTEGDTNAAQLINILITNANEGVTSRIVNLKSGNYGVTEPIIMKSKVSLIGEGESNSTDDGVVIRPLSNLTSIITQDLDQTSESGTLYTIKITGIQIYGDKDNYTVDKGIYLRCVNADIHDNRVKQVTGIGMHFEGFGDGGYDWINWITKNRVGGCDEGGILYQGTDSRITENYISNNGDDSTGDGYGLQVYSAGGVNIVANMIDLNGVGLALYRSDNTESTATMISANYFDQNYRNITIGKKDEQSGGLNARHAITGNFLHRAGNNTTTELQSTDCADIWFLNACNSTVITGNVMTSAAALCNIYMNSSNINMSISGNNMANAAPVVNLPTSGTSGVRASANSGDAMWENWAQASNSGGSQTITITHGLWTTPANYHVEFISGGSKNYQISNITDTTFDLVLSEVPSGSFTYKWFASVL